MSTKKNNMFVGVESVEGKKILYVLQDEKQFQLDSLYDETSILDKWFNQFENTNYRSRYFLFGFGNGMFVRKILQNVGEEAVVIVIEPSNTILDKVRQEFDVLDILEHKQVRLLITDNEDSKAAFRKLLKDYLSYEDIVGCAIRSYLNYPMLFEEQYKEFIDTIRLHINILNANNTFYGRLGNAFFYNIFANYPFMAKGKSLINLNKKMPKDIPAILVSAGPSLDKNVKELKKAKNRSFILSTDSAAKALIKHGIEPDMIMTIDPKKQYKHFQDDKIRKIPLLCSLHSAREILEIHKGDKYFYHDGNPHIEEIFEKFNKMLPTVQGGGSVATDAYAMLERLQFKTIILVGQDLAYTDNRTHASNTVRGEENGDVSEEDTLTIEGIDGEMIKTSYEFQLYLDWFEEEIKKNPQYKVIDATEGGARIKGTIIKTLSEAIREECNNEINMEEILKSVVFRLTDKEQEAFINHIHELPERYERLKEIVNDAIQRYEKLFSLIISDKYRNRKFSKMYSDVSELLEKIESAPEYYYINLLLQELLFENEEDLYANKDNEKEELIDAVEKAIKYYKVLKDAIEGAIWVTPTWLDIAENSEKRPNAILPPEALGLVQQTI